MFDTSASLGAIADAVVTQALFFPTHISQISISSLYVTEDQTPCVVLSCLDREVLYDGLKFVALMCYRLRGSKSVVKPDICKATSGPHEAER